MSCGICHTPGPKTSGPHHATSCYRYSASPVTAAELRKLHKNPFAGSTPTGKPAGRITQFGPAKDAGWGDYRNAPQEPVPRTQRSPKTQTRTKDYCRICKGPHVLHHGRR